MQIVVVSNFAQLQTEIGKPNPLRIYITQDIEFQNTLTVQGIKVLQPKLGLDFVELISNGSFGFFNINFANLVLKNIVLNGKNIQNNTSAIGVNTGGTLSLRNNTSIINILTSGNSGAVNNFEKLDMRGNSSIIFCEGFRGGAVLNTNKFTMRGNSRIE